MLSQHLFDILIANIWWTVAQAFINHIIFWKSVHICTFRCIYVNCYNILIFFPEVSTKLAKMHFFCFWTITQERNMETRQMTPSSSTTFSTLTVCNIHFCIWIHFYVVPFGQLQSTKYPNFEQKLLTWIAHHTFLESRHPEVTKNSYYVLSPEGSQKKGISSWTKSDYLNKVAKIKE